MKKYFFLFIFTFSILNSCTSEKTTTYYLIRHAEKDRSDITNRNPNLNFDGEKRAQNWSNFFKEISLDAVYSTKYNRTIQTATPTSQDKKIEIQFYNPNNLYDSVFKENTKGKVVLIVGHSNTTPAFANAILEENKYNDMDDKDNASLFIISVKGNKKTGKIEKVN
ncbi:SixA phosphatase family protein [Polaribacter ponticola]|uniref:Phosphoglycerate mutase family protein n=1 Tax=Polaribacter ponticola TaxID=2978475 RepID=A0ABT5S9N8_9FLAO|nr:phosphoglycerate mutase family protein [Polaribacter sp. MSW5]MDD7914012.1 phosphoglycerate mutase family protein [Polaribacter sp. MSW5]